MLKRREKLCRPLLAVSEITFQRLPTYILVFSLQLVLLQHMFKFNSFVCVYPCLHISTAEGLSLAQIFTAKEAQRSTSLSLECSRFTSGCRPPARCNCAVNMFTGYKFILKMYIYLFCFMRL